MDNVIESLIQTAETLAAIQVEGIQDETGFSNADKAVGYRLADALRAEPTDEDTTVSLAALVSKYRRQATAMVGEEMFEEFRKLGKGGKITLEQRENARKVVIVTSGVHPDFAGTQAVFRFNYNETYAEAIKNLGGRARKDANGWKYYAPVANAQEIMLSLFRLGAKVLGTIENELLEAVETAIVEAKKPEVRGNKINATHVGNAIRITFPYNPTLVTAIKRIDPKDRSFNWDDKVWIVRDRQLDNLKTVFAAVGADTSDLEAIQGVAVPAVMQQSAVENIVVPAGIYAFARPYQREGIDFLTRTLDQLRADNPGSPHIKGIIVGDEMGLGKSFQTLVAALAIRQPGDAPIVIVCPANAKFKWAGKEVPLAAGGDGKYDVCVVGNGTVANVRRSDNTIIEVRSEKKVRANCDILIINYDILRTHYFDILNMGVSILITDEGHYFKNRGVARSILIVGGLIVTKREPTPLNPANKERKRITGLRAAATRRVFVLSGTPITNRLRDLYNLLKAVGHRHGQLFTQFGMKFCDPTFNSFAQSQYSYDGASNEEQLRRDIDGCFIMRKTKDVAKDIPAVTRDWFPVEIDARAYNQAMAEFYERQAERVAKAKAEGREINDTIHLADLTAARTALSIAKAPSSVEIAKQAIESGHKILIATAFTPALDYIVAALEKEYGVGSVVKFNGETSSKNREKAVNAFMTDPKCMAFVGNIVSAGTAIDLTTATRVHFNDLVWVPSDMKQFWKRANRIGSTMPCYVTISVAGDTIDEDLASLLEEKFEVIENFEGFDKGATLFPELMKRLMSGPRNKGLTTHKKGKK